VKRISWITLLLFSLAACATHGNMVHHSFGFDTITDSPDVEVLDYQYGDAAHYETGAEPERVALGQVFVAGSVSADMPRGDTLYVKWRDKHSHQVYQDRVDLKNRMPQDISGLTIYFMIKGAQLYVYLIYPGLKDASVPKGSVRTYQDQKQVQIYPDVRK
jgi:hypothetical protein